MPNTKEKLIKALSKSIPYGYGTLCLIADELIANGVRLESEQATSDKASKWISVKERLPTREDATEKGAVLAWEISLRHWDLWSWDCVGDYPNRFVGWMPLPQPPKGG